MEAINVDKLLAGMESAQVGNNALNIMDMLKEVNSVIKEVQKTSNMLDAMGLKPLLVRAAGIKLGVDAESPLKQDTSVAPKTDTHKYVFEQLNKMGEEQIANLFGNQKVEEVKEPDVPDES